MNKDIAFLNVLCFSGEGESNRKFYNQFPRYYYSELRMGWEWWWHTNLEEILKDSSSKLNVLENFLLLIPQRSEEITYTPWAIYRGTIGVRKILWPEISRNDTVSFSPTKPHFADKWIWKFTANVLCAMQFHSSLTIDTYPTYLSKGS